MEGDKPEVPIAETEPSDKEEMLKPDEGPSVPVVAKAEGEPKPKMI